MLPSSDSAIRYEVSKSVGSSCAGGASVWVPEDKRQKAKNKMHEAQMQDPNPKREWPLILEL